MSMKRLSSDEDQRIAANIAKLPRPLAEAVAALSRCCCSDQPRGAVVATHGF